MAPVKAGRYQLLEELGRGAMGVVYKAFDPVIGRSVAVKVLRLNATGSGMDPAELVSRFQTETRAAGLLTHANIVSVFDAGEEDGLFYITMEYVEGASLQARLDKGQVFALPRMLHVMEQACAGLGYAHRRNIVHRDVKPANVLLAPDDTLKITDFGTAKILQLGTTQSGHVIGTPSYMSPEQVMGKLVDGRSDIFSLGVILYELITGEKPFPGQNVTTVIYKIVNTEPIPPKELDGSVPSGLNFIVTKALAKDPGARFATCEEMLDALRRYPELGPSAEETVRIARPMGRDAGAGIGAGASVGGRVSGVAVGSGAAAAAAAMAPMAAGAAEAAPAATPMADAAVVAGPAGAPVAAGAAPVAKAVRGPKSGVKRRATVKPVAAPGTAAPGAAPPISRGWMKRMIAGLVIFLAVAGADIGYLYWPNIRHAVKNSMAEMAGRGETGGATVTSGAPAPAPGGTNGTAPAASGAADGNSGQPGEAPAAGSLPNVIPMGARELSRARDQIEKRFREWGFGEKVKVFVSGTELGISGILNRAEHNQLVDKIRAAWPTVPWSDHTQIAEGAAGGGAGKGGVNVITSVAGAHVVLKNYDGKQVGACDAPCAFKDLPPGNYSVEATLAGYRPIIKILDVKSGPYFTANLPLDALFTSILVTSTPPGAEVFLNGEKQTELTPATFYPAAGPKTVVARKGGYAESSLPVKGEAEHMYHVDFPLTPGVNPSPAPTPPVPPHPGNGPTGTLNVRTVPPGAAILIVPGGAHEKTPKRIDLAPGEYTVTLLLPGYKPLKKKISVTANKETPLNETLAPSSP
jgi:Protein kinase domain/PEGA domain